MTETTTYCATHPQIESRLRCSRCEKLICARCMVQTPVGARCRDCARLRRLPLFEAGPGDLARGLAAGLAVALVGSAAIELLGPRFLELLLLLALGYLVGQAVASAANRKRAASLATVAAGSTVVGGLLGPHLLLALSAPGLLLGSLLFQLAANPLRLLVLAVAAVLAWHQVR